MLLFLACSAIGLGLMLTLSWLHSLRTPASASVRPARNPQAAAPVQVVINLNAVVVMQSPQAGIGQPAMPGSGGSSRPVLASGALARNSAAPTVVLAGTRPHHTATIRPPRPSTRDAAEPTVIHPRIVSRPPSGPTVITPRLVAHEPSGPTVVHPRALSRDAAAPSLLKRWSAQAKRLDAAGSAGPSRPGGSSTGRERPSAFFQPMLPCRP